MGRARCRIASQNAEREHEAPWDAILSSGVVKSSAVEAARTRAGGLLRHPGMREDPRLDGAGVGPGGEDRGTFDDMASLAARPSEACHDSMDRLVAHLRSLCVVEHPLTHSAVGERERHGGRRLAVRARGLGFGHGALASAQLDAAQDELIGTIGHPFIPPGA